MGIMMKFFFLSSVVKNYYGLHRDNMHLILTWIGSFALVSYLYPTYDGFQPHAHLETHSAFFIHHINAP